MLSTDVREAWRALLSGRLFAVVAVLCLGLAIATNTTLFSVFDAMFLRPLPFVEPGRLVSVAGRDRETGRRAALTTEDVRDLRSTVNGLEAIAAHAGRMLTVTDGGDPERVSAQFVSAGLFSVLGVQPQRGGTIEIIHDRPGGDRVVLIADSLWRRRYQAAAEGVIGRELRLDNVSYTIAGIMPPRFRFPSTSELWLPMASAAALPGGPIRSVSIVGRLAPSTSLASANAELASVVLPATGTRRARDAVARRYGPAPGGEEQLIIRALMGATTVLLIMACVNVGNLLLARGAQRRRDIAVRAALGASRGRIFRQSFIESIMLAIVATAVALPLAALGIQWIHEAVPANDPLGPYYVDWRMDTRLLLYSLSIACLSGVAFGLAPAFGATGQWISNPLRDSAGQTGGRARRRVHAALIVVQIALTVALLAGAALFVRTYAGLRGVVLGYDMSHLMTMRVYLSGTRYDEPTARERAIDELARRLTAVAGAHAATISDLIPLDDQGGSDAPARVEGRTFEEGREPTVHYAGVAGRWVETLDLRLLAGRTFRDEELGEKAPVALVNATLASAFWPGENAIGRRFRLAEDQDSPWLTVIGVVPSIRTVKLDENQETPPTAYLPHRFVSTRNYGIILRTASVPASVTADVRAVVRGFDPDLALFDVYPMAQVHWLSYWMYVMWGTMFGVLAAIAVIIAAVGVYGVVFFTVAQRTREIGLRVALGAQRRQVVLPIVREVALLTCAGVAAGIGGALFVTPVVESLLIGVTPNDPGGYILAAGLIALIVLVATWIPAWSASAVDPLIALRRE